MLFRSWTASLWEISVSAVDGKLALAPVTRLKIGSAKMATPPFGTNAIRYDEMLGTDMYVLLNARTAGKLGLKQDDAVKLAASGSECRACVHIFEDVIDDTVVAPLG